ncbi:hypothetical protein CVU37_09630 [candidate division BRC1 bacterium HGW-BRC1-1]|jgi:hypothetical protein|nr:MAG: hypothetical protein CVU37_09630 [candidate division BRC1 bacterium HGW-BRC1-1]
MTEHLTTYSADEMREYLEAHAAQLAERHQGIEVHALYREIYASFAQRTAQHDTVLVAPVEAVLVLVFIPSAFAGAHAMEIQRQAEEKALALLAPADTPLAMELVSMQDDPPAIEGKCRLDQWADEEFLTLLDDREATIVAYFDGGSFFQETLRPHLEKRGFELIDSYTEALEQGFVRVRHSATSSTIFQVPWVRWVREMVSGGFDLVFLMACLAVYLQKLEQAAIQNT